MWGGVRYALPAWLPQYCLNTQRMHSRCIRLQACNRNGTRVHEVRAASRMVAACRVIVVVTEAGARIALLIFDTVHLHLHHMEVANVLLVQVAGNLVAQHVSSVPASRVRCAHGSALQRAAQSHD